MLHYHHKLASALTKVTWKASQKGSGHYRKYMCPGLYQQIMPITQRSPTICFTDTWDCLELCRRVRDTKDTTDIPETPKIGGKHSIYVRDTTVVFRTTHVCRGNTDMSRISQACQDYHMSFRETLHTCWGHQRCVTNARHMSGKQETFRRQHLCVQNTTEVPGSSESCKGHLRRLETVKFFSGLLPLVSPDTNQGHHGHQRPADDTRDVSGIPHSCLGCVSQVYSV